MLQKIQRLGDSSHRLIQAQKQLPPKPCRQRRSRQSRQLTDRFDPQMTSAPSRIRNRSARRSREMEPERPPDRPSPLLPSPGTPGEGQGGDFVGQAAFDPHPNPPPQYMGRGKFWGRSKCDWTPQIAPSPTPRRDWGRSRTAPSDASGASFPKPAGESGPIRRKRAGSRSRRGRSNGRRMWDKPAAKTASSSGPARSAPWHREPDRARGARASNKSPAPASASSPAQRLERRRQHWRRRWAADSQPSPRSPRAPHLWDCHAPAVLGRPNPSASSEIARTEFVSRQCSRNMVFSISPP